MLPSPSARGVRERAASAAATVLLRQNRQALLDYGPTGDEAIDDHDDRDHKQNVNQSATHVYYEEPEYPQDEENYRDRPKHDGILARSELHLERREMSQALRIPGWARALW